MRLCLRFSSVRSTAKYVHLIKLQSETFSIKPPLLGAERGGTESFALFSLYTQPAFSKDCNDVHQEEALRQLAQLVGKKKKNWIMCFALRTVLYDMEYWVCWCVLEDDMLFDLQLLMKKNPKNTQSQSIQSQSMSTRRHSFFYWPCHQD